VEKPHLKEATGSITAGIVQNSSEQVTTIDSAVLWTGGRKRSLLVHALMRKGGIVAGCVFLEHTELMSLIQNQQVVKTLMSN
jgi:hypothetical protein